MGKKDKIAKNFTEQISIRREGTEARDELLKCVHIFLVYRAAVTVLQMRTLNTENLNLLKWAESEHRVLMESKWLSFFWLLLQQQAV